MKKFDYFSEVVSGFQLRLLAADLAALALAFLVCGVLYPEYPTVAARLLYTVLLTVCLYVSGRYNGDRFRSSRYSRRRVLVAIVLSALLIYPFLSGFDTSRILYLTQLSVLVACFVVAAGYLVERFYQKPLPVVCYVFFKPDKNIISRANEITRRFKARGIDVVWEYDVSEKRLHDRPFGSSDTLIYDDIRTASALKSQLLELKIKGARVLDFIDYYTAAMGRVPVDLITESWVLDASNGLYAKPAAERINRVLDLFLGSILLVILTPLTIVIALAIKLDDGGPVFFVQERLGKNKAPFKLVKFRSMRLNAEQGGPQWASRSDPRTTRIGAFLRKTHLDELPQLIHLLRGEMTLVGPRPIRAYFASVMAAEIRFYDLRFLVKPGLTGWAQIKGPYGANVDEQKDKFEMDLYFIQRSSVLMNLYILFGTGRHVSVQAGYE